MNKKLLSFLPLSISLTALSFFSSCNDDIKPINGGGENLTVNEWIVNSLEEKYLWNDEIKEKSKNYNDTPERLFKSLLSLKDGKVINGEHHAYSYIKSTAETKSVNAESTYGFEFQVYNFINPDGSYAGESWAKVLYVLPESSAEKAGLKRGDWIFYINNNILTKDNYLNLYNGEKIRLGINYIDNPITIELEPSYKMNENPILLDTVLKIGNDKVGYLVYNQFAIGPDDNPKDNTYDNQLIDLFKNKFFNEDINELVLDLRYNGGGYLSCAKILGGLIIPEQYKNEVFCYTKNNKDKYQTYKFVDNGFHLNLSRVFVLVSARTASASEAIINGLQPYMEVILIGNKTEGKNVGSEIIENDKYDWEMHPITVQIYNKEYNSDYSDGFTPEKQLTLDELDLYTMPYFYPLGDTREYYLSKAISLITGYSEKANVKRNALNSTSLSDFELGANSLDRKNSGGVLID